MLREWIVESNEGIDDECKMEREPDPKGQMECTPGEPLAVLQLPLPDHLVVHRFPLVEEFGDLRSLVVPFCVVIDKVFRFLRQVRTDFVNGEHDSFQCSVTTHDLQIVTSSNLIPTLTRSISILDCPDLCQFRVY